MVGEKKVTSTVDWYWLFRQGALIPLAALKQGDRFVWAPPDLTGLSIAFAWRVSILNPVAGYNLCVEESGEHAPRQFFPGTMVVRISEEADNG